MHLMDGRSRRERWLVGVFDLGKDCEKVNNRRMNGRWFGTVCESCTEFTHGAFLHRVISRCGISTKVDCERRYRAS